MDAESFYDDMADGYLDTFRTKSMMRVMKIERDLIISHMPSSSGKLKVLEVGTGPGRLSAEIVKRNVDFTGIDISKEMLRACRKRVGPEPILIQHDAGKGLPFPDSSFDYIYSLRVLKYVGDLPMVLKEVHRTLKDDGIFLFSMPNKLSINMLHMRQHVEYQRFTMGGLKEVLKKYDLITKEIIGGPRLPEYLYQRDSERMYDLIIKVERGIEGMFHQGLTREPFYVCQRS